MDDAFEILNVWKRSRRLAIDIHETFSTCNDYGIKSQITRAAASIPSSIAEGYERNSGKDFVNLLLLARESCTELQTQLSICEEISLIEMETASKLEQETREIHGILQGLIQYYKNKIKIDP